MLTIKIRNFRGVRSVDIECAPIALVAGANFEGKSSVCQAAAATITGNATAGFYIPQKEAQSLVYDGAEKALADITQDNSRVSMSWPECKGTTVGENPPRATAFAVGLLSLPELNEAERAKLLEEYLHTSPNRDDLGNALGDKFKPAVIDQLWALIERDGWDRVHADQIDKRRKTAGAWEQATGGNFGSQKAKGWTPENWDPLILEIGEEQLTKDVADDEAALELAIAANAVNRAERERLTTLAGRVTDLEVAKEALAAKWRDVHASLEAAKTDSAENATSAKLHLPCPHCGEPIEIRSDLATTTLVKATVMPEDELKRRRSAKADADGRVSRLTHERGELEREVAENGRYLAEARAADAKLKALDPTMEEAGSPDFIRKRLDQTKANLAAVKTYNEAQRLYRRWENHQLVIDVLKPDGIRQKKLIESIELFNQTKLASLCIAAKWAPVTIAPDDLGLLYGGRRYTLLSESEQYRARVTMQVAQAQLDGSQLLVIDRADILDSAGRNGLFALLRAVQIPAVIGMTIGRTAALPDLSAAGLGKAYRIEGGTLQ